jgi:coproporphyrinogen III oxidase-like Fe-S oxidoreductase
MTQSPDPDRPIARSPDPDRAITRSPDRQILGLYLHIPFCSAICNYCNFNRGLFDAAQKARYVDALISEIEAVGITHLIEARGRRADSIYFAAGRRRCWSPMRSRGSYACRRTLKSPETLKSRSRRILKASRARLAVP